MIEIEVTDFQSIRHTAVAIDRFSAIVGRSNIGKSALVRAVQMALTNAVGTDFVRHGAACDRAARGTKKCKCFSRVRVKTPVIEFTWEKGDSINRYVVVRDGSSQEYEGLERGTPAFLAGMFDQAKIGDTKELVQIPDQFEPIFLLNRAGTVVADVLSDVAQLDKINVAMALAVKDKKEDVATRKVRAQDVATLEKVGEFYIGLDAATDTAHKLRDHLANVKKLQDGIDLLSTFITKALSLTQTTAAMTVAVSPVLPDYESLSNTCKKHSDLDGYFSRLSDIAPKIRSLTGISKIDLPDDTSIRSTYKKLEGLRGLQSRLQGLETYLEGWHDWASVPVVEDPTPIRPKFESLQKINVFISRVVSIEASFLTIKKDLAAATQLEEAIVQDLETLGVCPTCTQTISGKHLHSEAS